MSSTWFRLVLFGLLFNRTNALAAIHGVASRVDQYRDRDIGVSSPRKSAGPPPSSHRLPAIFVEDRIYNAETGGVLANLTKNNFSMHSIYGDAGPADVYSSFWHTNAQRDTCLGCSAYFDEYVLEKIMLGKWMSSQSRSDCPRTADIVVVPSAFLSSLVEFGWTHESIVRLELPHFRKFWSRLRGAYFADDHNPLLVVHMSFSWGSQRLQAKADMLQALSEQPASFISRVVIGAIESNLGKAERSLFDENWSGSALAELRRRELARLSGEAWSARKSPLLVTLPYPTSILNPLSFWTREGEPRVGSSERTIAVSMMGAPKKSAWIRTSLMNMFPKVERDKGGGHVCIDSKRTEDNCGLGKRVHFWDVSLRSIFCLEPAGDTPTRSHFYVAVLSGCIPVIFDGGHDLYDASTPTWWAWRASSSLEADSVLPNKIENMFLNYTDFTVVFNSSDVQAGRIDVLHELLSMPADRLRVLRLGLARASALMTYSRDDDDDDDAGSAGQSLSLEASAGGSVEKRQDAFSAFYNLVAWEALQ